VKDIKTGEPDAEVGSLRTIWRVSSGGDRPDWELEMTDRSKVLRGQRTQGERARLRIQKAYFF
jgi:hypothetical protein